VKSTKVAEPPATLGGIVMWSYQAAPFARLRRSRHFEQNRHVVVSGCAVRHSPWMSRISDLVVLPFEEKGHCVPVPDYATVH